ncbi:hypothetical protein MC885_015622 [Smutsia gigantea]|nr:hypothetical protein MC885_015622 [Smutsia gigantea]
MPPPKEAAGRGAKASAASGEQERGGCRDSGGRPFTGGSGTGCAALDRLRNARRERGVRCLGPGDQTHF